MRAKLEAHPRLGTLDGDVRMEHSSSVATFNRAGNNPLLTIQITAASRGFTQFTMTHWDLKSGQ